MGEYGDAFRTALAAELRAQRARVEITVDELAKRTDLAKSTVLNYLKGKRDVPMGTFFELCLAMDANPEVLVRNAHDAAE